MPSIHFILFFPLVLMPSNFPSIRVFSNEPALCIRWPKDWSFSVSISHSREYLGLLSFRIDWFNLLDVLLLSRVFCSTKVWTHQLFGAHPSFWSNFHLHTWLLKNHSFDYMDLLIVLFVFLFLLRYRSSLYILDINLYKIIWKYFLPLCCLPFCSIDCILLILMKSNLFIFTFVTSVFGYITKKSLPKSVSWNIFYVLY